MVLLQLQLWLAGTDINKFVEWRPDSSIVRGNVDDVRLAIHILSSLRQEPHSNLEKHH